MGFSVKLFAFFARACYTIPMDKKKSPVVAKKFPYQFTKALVFLAIAVIALCGLGIGVSAYRIAKFGVRSFTEALQSPLLIAVCAFCIVLVLAILAKSQYVIDGENYIVQFGFIKSKYAIKNITALELDSDEKKLTLYVGEEFSVLSLSEKWQDEFIVALREINPDISFSFTLAEK